MGCWDVYCNLCGNTCHEMFDSDDPDYDKIKKAYGKKLKWLNKCTFLTINNEVIHNCKEVSCNTDFTNGKRYFRAITPCIENSLFREHIDNLGIFVHTDCWKFVKRTYNIKLQYGDFSIDRFKKQKKCNYTKYLNINYGDIEKYWGQEFDFVKAYRDKKDYLCESPLVCVNTGNRVKTIFNSLKLRGRDRGSPSVSATLFSKGVIKIGNDNNFWKIDNGKWVKMSGENITKNVEILDTNKKDIDNLEKIPHIGETNTKPMFIESFTLNKQNRKKIYRVKIRVLI